MASRQTNKTDIYTFNTPVGGNQLIYSAESWVRLRLILETAGPVSISTKEDVIPTLSGRGILLLTNQQVEFTLPKGSRLFLTSDTVNRVKVIIEPIPFLETIVRQLEAGFGGMTGLLAAFTRRKDPLADKTKDPRGVIRF